MLAGGLPCPLFEPSWLISTRVEHLCGVGWVGGWGGLFKNVVVARVKDTWNICVGWGVCVCVFFFFF